MLGLDDRDTDRRGEQPRGRVGVSAISRFFRLGLSTLIVIGGLTVVGVATAPMAVADAVIPLPPPATATTPPVKDRTAATVTADPLPTVQIGTGVVWKAETAGHIVFAGGQFSTARPAGAAAGTNEVTRNNLLAFDVTTGNLISSINPNVNGPVKDVVLSPDGSTIYIAGSFTQVSGQSRIGVAALDATTGQLTSWDAKLNGFTYTVAATNSAVYVGGTFSAVNNVRRTYFAAVSASSGALLAWAPVPDAPPQAMVMSPDMSRVIIGGRFTVVNDSPAYGIAAIDANTAALLPYAINTVVRNAGSAAATQSLAVDSDTVYGTSYNYGGGNFEGTWAATPDTGDIVWLDDCHGDTLDTFSADNGVVYNVGHAHHCVNIGGFPDTNPRVPHAAMAFTKSVGGLVQKNAQGGAGYGNFAGQPAPSIIDWFPTMSIGSFTGANQAAWTLTGNSTYLVAGGEFTGVNGVPQYGLVRFAVASVAPKKSGPVQSGTQLPVPTAAAVGNAVRIGWQANWDRDDMDLTYRILRSDRGSNPVGTVSAQSLFWYQPSLTFRDTSVAASSTYTYRIQSVDADGNVNNYRTVTLTTPSTLPISTYAQSVLDRGAIDYWRMSEFAATGASADWAGSSSLTGGSGVGTASSDALLNDTDAAASLSGSTSGRASTTTAISGPQTFSIEAWFKSTTTSGGKIVGFGNNSSGSSSSYDRHIYMDKTGRINFGVYPGSTQILRSTDTYNDGAWHQVVATLGAGGMALFVDDQRVGFRADTTSAQEYSGYWRIGGDTLNGWPNQPSSDNFKGDIDEVAIYPTALSLQQVDAAWVASGRDSTNTNHAPSAVFTSTVTNMKVDFDGSGSSDTDGSIATYSWDFGDNSPAGTESEPSHTYTTAGTYQVTLKVTDNDGASNSVTHAVTVAPPNAAPTADFSSDVSGRSVSFDGSGSSDTDGTIASYSWDFGDNSATGTGSKPSHTYSVAGTYQVKLTVTDNDGATDSVTHPVTVLANAVPEVVFTFTASGLKVDFDGSGSSDSDGTIASYSWDFGDNSAPGSGSKPSHTYSAADTYQVKLTVTDNDGGTGSVTHAVTVTLASSAPAAEFTSETNDLKADFDGSGSSDSDGTIASYSWDFGDNSAPGSGSKPSHTYTTAGTYQVKLTVTDNDGATGSITHPVTVTSPGPQALAADAFTRTTSSSWGTADIGGAWTVTGGASLFATNSSTGRMKLTAVGQYPTAMQNAVAVTDGVVQFDVALDSEPTGAGYQLVVMARRAGGADYRVKLRFNANDTITLTISRVSGSETGLAAAVVPGVTFAPNTMYRVKFALATSGSATALKAKLYPAGGTEPTGWNVQANDSTAALQHSGAVGLQATATGSVTNLPVVFAIDNWSVTTEG